MLLSAGTLDAGVSKSMNHIHLCRLCGEQNIRWWQDPATGATIERDTDELLMLVISEFAEGLEGERKSLKDTHLPQYPMLHVELADAYIRLGDTLYHRDWWAGSFVIAGRRIGASSKALLQAKTVGGQLLILTALVVHAGSFVNSDKELPVRGQSKLRYAIASAMLCVEYMSQLHGFDLETIVLAKLAYNQNRLDHTHEARLKAGGKKF
jgi:hypothetical protein